MNTRLSSSRRRLLPLAGVACALITACGGGDASEHPASDLSAAQVERAVQGVDALMPQLMARSGVPGAAVAIVWRGELQYAKGFGVLEAGGSEAVDPDTVFQLASLSKPVGATVVATQVDAGRVEWDTPVARHLPDFLLSGDGPQPTIGDLYAHRSGLAEHVGDQLEDLGHGRADILERLRYVPIEPLGSHYAYTNFGLTAAGQAVANAAGADWAELSERQLYQPLGMARTSSRFADFMARDNRAIPHAWEGGRYQALYQRRPDAQSPAGGVSSSVRDMARWLALLQGGGTFDGRKLFDPAALAPALVRQAPQGVEYGFGFNVGKDSGGRPMLSHSGAFLMGASTVFMLWPDSALGIVVLTNAAPSGLAEGAAMSLIELAHDGRTSRDWYALIHEQFQQEMYQLFGSLAGQSPPAHPAPSLPLERYVGAYGNTYYGQAAVTLENGGLVLALGAGGATRHPLRHWDGERFVFDLGGENATPGSVSYLDFAADGDGNVTGLRTEYYAEDLAGGRFTREPPP